MRFPPKKNVIYHFVINLIFIVKALLYLEILKTLSKENVLIQVFKNNQSVQSKNLYSLSNLMFNYNPINNRTIVWLISINPVKENHQIVW